MSSGDRVMAENYLQHAEHYNRIIAAAQAQMPIQNMQNTAATIPTTTWMTIATSSTSVGKQCGESGQRQPATHADSRPTPARQQMNLGSGPQPVIEGTPAEVALNPEAVRRRRAPARSATPMDRTASTAASAEGGRRRAAGAGRAAASAAGRTSKRRRRRRRAGWPRPDAGARRRAGTQRCAGTRRGREPATPAPR